MKQVDYANCGVVPRLPTAFGGDRGDSLPPGLVGSKVVGFGMPDATVPPPEGSGLVIDYETPDGRRERVVFSFNECGMWVTYQSRPSSEASPASSS